MSIDRQRISAVRTLEALDFTYEGGEHWKPPLGQPPARLVPRVGGMQEQDELTRLRSEKAAGDFWRGVFDGITDKTEREKIEAELHDFRFMMQQVPKVYGSITGGLLSKRNYYAESVISAAEDYTQQLIDEAIEEAKEEAK